MNLDVEPPATGPSRWLWALLPLLVLAVAAWPCLGYQLPSFQSQLGEDYQPLDTLRFFQSRGHAFQRYGVFPNFLLAPGYGASLAYWRATGDWGEPSSDFPYGLQRPLEQMGFLLWQGRWLFFVLNLVLFMYYLRSLAWIVPSGVAIAVGFAYCLGTNTSLALHMANTRPDGIALALTAITLAVFHRMLVFGMTTRRAIAFSVVAVCALSSKELAAFMFVLPCAALGFRQLGTRRLHWARSTEEDIAAAGLGQRLWPVAVMLATGVIAYALINIVYAPDAWWVRMQYWLGHGADKDVFFDSAEDNWAAAREFCRQIGASLLGNLGPAGIFIAPGLAMVAWWAYPRQAFWLTLPILSVVILFLLPLGFAQERYYLYVALGLVPLASLGCAHLLDGCRAAWLRRTAIGILATGLAVNLSYLPLAWYALPMRTQYIVEQDVPHRVRKDELLYIFTHDVAAQPPGKHRLAAMGYNWDSRGVTELMQSSHDARPDWIYAERGAEVFVDAAPQHPARVRYFLDMANVDTSQWPGIAALGYERVTTLVPQAPAWFPWKWTPAIDELQRLEQVTVYRKRPL